METISAADEARIVQALNTRGVAGDCKHCRGGKLRIVDHIARIPIAGGFTGDLNPVTGFATANFVMTACANCGDTHFHAAQSLGLTV